MKYIRTKDRIENVENLFPADYYDMNGNAYKLESDSMAATKIDYKKLFPNNRVADTIEELCDEFVILNPNEKPFIMCLPISEFQKEGSLKIKEEEHIEIYGAIWTDKGLIYVAKMNEKGELELL